MYSTRHQVNSSLDHLHESECLTSRRTNSSDNTNQFMQQQKYSTGCISDSIYMRYYKWRFCAFINESLSIWESSWASIDSFIIYYTESLFMECEQIYFVLYFFIIPYTWSCSLTKLEAAKTIELRAIRYVCFELCKLIKNLLLFGCKLIFIARKQLNDLRGQFKLNEIEMF